MRNGVLLASNNMTEICLMNLEACIYSQKELYILHPQKECCHQPSEVKTSAIVLEGYFTMVHK